MTTGDKINQLTRQQSICDAYYNEQINNIQEECDHVDAYIMFESDTGNYCPSYDSYWANLRCPDCLKRWTVDSDDEDYSSTRYEKVHEWPEDVL